MSSGTRSGIKTAIIIIAAGIVVLAIAAVLAINALIHSRIDIPVIPDKQENGGYATDYPLYNGQKASRVYGTWCVEKYIGKDDGVVYLTAWNSGKKESMADYIRVHVYDTAEIARDRYDRIYDKYKQYGDYGWEEGDGWFTAMEPNVCDASIRSITRLKDNVILYAEIEITGEWGVEPDMEPVEPVPLSKDPSSSYFDRSLLKDYVISHSGEVRSYIIDNVLRDQSAVKPDSNVNVTDGYIAIICNEYRDMVYKTYVYKTAVRYKYINTVSLVSSSGQSAGREMVDSNGMLESLEEVVGVAEQFNSAGYVKYPGDSREYSIDDLLKNDL